MQQVTHRCQDPLGLPMAGAVLVAVLDLQPACLADWILPDSLCDLCRTLAARNGEHEQALGFDARFISWLGEVQCRIAACFVAPVERRRAGRFGPRHGQGAEFNLTRR